MKVSHKRVEGVTMELHQEPATEGHPDGFKFWQVAEADMAALEKALEDEVEGFEHDGDHLTFEGHRVRPA